MRTADVVVIGAGVIGSSIAYHLARAGHRVLVLDGRDVAAEPTASWASAGGVRRQGRAAAEVPLAIEAAARWPMLGEELGAELRYRQGGNLLLAEDESGAERLAAFVDTQHHNGFADVRLVDRAEVNDLVPGIGTQVVAGSYAPGDGQADPVLTTQAFAGAAQRHGATYWTRTSCHALSTHGERVTGARTARADVDADVTIVAAGAWSGRLLASVGVRLPVTMLALQMLRSTAATPNVLVPVLSALGRALSLKQVPGGAFLVGGGWPGDITEDERGYVLQPESITGNWQAACAVLPAVAAQSIAAAWCGLEAMSADGLPYVGSVPGRDGLLVATGFSGHGFAIAPAVGRAVADQLAGQPVPELHGLRPDRALAT
jgi:sarcosine oxidase subunit beta